MAAYIPPYSPKDTYVPSYQPAIETEGGYNSPRYSAGSNPISKAFSSVGDYLTSSFQTQPAEPRTPTVSGIASLDNRYSGASSVAKLFEEYNPNMLSRLPTNMDVKGNQLKNSWGELGLGGQINAAADTIGGLYQAYTGGREVKLAKAQMRFNKDAWNKEYGNAVQDVNRSLRDRQQLRNYYNPDMYGNPDDYVAKYGAK